MEFKHIPVMKKECVEGLNIKPFGVYFDGTVGGGNHSYAILSAEKTARLIGTDLDDEAIAAANEKLAPFAGRFKIYKSNFKDFERVFKEENIDKIDGALLDLGVSSHQIDDGERGFSYRSKEAPLDMRMNTSQALTAKQVINEYPPERLKRIIEDYGEEKFASQIVKNIVRARSVKEISTCGELADIIEESVPVKFRFGAPCERKTFQAVRIEVNGELDGLYELIIRLTRRLKIGGRIAVLTFHSLEDRIVKDAFKELETDCICPKNIPVCVCGKKREVKILTRKPITAGEEEVLSNSRSKCAKLRIAEKV